MAKQKESSERIASDPQIPYASVNDDDAKMHIPGEYFPSDSADGTWQDKLKALTRRLERFQAMHCGIQSEMVWAGSDR